MCHQFETFWRKNAKITTHRIGCEMGDVVRGGYQGLKKLVCFLKFRQRCLQSYIYPKHCAPRFWWYHKNQLLSSRVKNSNEINISELEKKCISLLRNIGCPISILVFYKAERLFILTYETVIFIATNRQFCPTSKYLACTCCLGNFNSDLIKVFFWYLLRCYENTTTQNCTIQHMNMFLCWETSQTVYNLLVSIS